MSTVDPAELTRFEQVAHEWWDPDGHFKPLHQINPLRLAYIRTHLAGAPEASLERLTLLDIGCGGGILSESLAQCGACVTAIDRSDKIIAVAQAHQRDSGSSVQYRVIDTGSLALEQPAAFDAVLAMEVLEHVADIPLFLRECASLVKPGGHLFFSTINKTWRAWLLAIVGAEYVLGWLPRGTHQFNKLVPPATVADHLRSCQIQLQHLSGISYHPLRQQWHLSRDLSVNYLGVGTRAT
ncbi:MAG: bifunctional 2-polyprenyl-6-hydroxyphenol methylase/3-demethylubiquinol 3-O-methyltransferase UbiG [Magnetococcales bacterium]|nr:bifunctional 2-polyprenyl-6-hydroxyphenol methylase/3-demethylubiquinol 3-O-methyltransferase UbiG [Magnetococcales bacterium]